MLSFSLLLFFSFAFLVFTLPCFPAEWQQYIEQKVEVCILDTPALLSSVLLPPCLCLSRCILPFIYLLTFLHLFYLRLHPPTTPFSLCPSLLLLSTAHEIQRERGEVNKATEMYSDGNNLINKGCFVTVNNVAPLANQCPRCD